MVSSNGLTNECPTIADINCKTVYYTAANLKSTRYSRRPPEFLLTHPVTESRISDSRNRAQQYPKKFYEKSTEYELVKIRVSLNNTNNYGEDVRRFENELRGNRFSKLAAQYGLV